MRSLQDCPEPFGGGEMAARWLCRRLTVVVRRVDEPLRGVEDGVGEIGVLRKVLCTSGSYESEVQDDGRFRAPFTDLRGLVWPAGHGDGTVGLGAEHQPQTPSN